MHIYIIHTYIIIYLIKPLLKDYNIFMSQGNINLTRLSTRINQVLPINLIFPVTYVVHI